VVAAQHEEPAASLIVRGLDPYTIEESVRYAFSSHAQVKEVRLVHDKQTGASRGFAFVEFYSVDDATRVLREAGSMRIDNHPVRMSFARGQDINRNSWGGYPQYTPEQAQWAGSYGQWSASSTPTGEDVNVAYQMATGAEPHAQTTQPVPDGFTLDPITGFYYNSTTGYYYDDRTHRYFYYDESSQQYYHFDQQTNSYLPYNPSGVTKPPPTTLQQQPPIQQQTQPQQQPVLPKANTLLATVTKAPSIVAASIAVKGTDEGNNDEQASAQATNNDGQQQQQNNVPVVAGPVKMIIKDAKIKKPPVTIFQKKISKEMERWNQKGKELKEAVQQEDKQKEQQKKAPPQLSATNIVPITPSPSVSQDHVTPIQTQPDIITTTATITATPPSSSTPTASSQVCFLCKRQFASAEALKKHETLSDLHKYNLDMARQRQVQQSQWAKENPSEESRPAKKTKRTEDEDPPHPGIGGGEFNESNIGYKMMKNAGWKEGEGLGRDASGMVNPLEATLRTPRAGLGMDDDARYAVTADDSYQQATRKKALSRFEAISGVKVDEIENTHPFLQGKRRK